MDTTTLIIGVITGAIGSGYFIYGKKQSEFVPLMAGLGLCFIPYIVGNIPLLIILCLALVVLPFVLKN
ncbi:MAG: hypothetical protein AABZ60_08910 [Planctomycetota bacterium]